MGHEIGSYLLDRRSYQDWLNSEATEESDRRFGNELSKEWASLPVLEDIVHERGRVIHARGDSYWDRTGNSHAQIRPEDFEAFLRALREEGAP